MSKEKRSPPAVSGPPDPDKDTRKWYRALQELWAEEVAKTQSLAAIQLEEDRRKALEAAAAAMKEREPVRPIVTCFVLYKNGRAKVEKHPRPNDQDTHYQIRESEMTTRQFIIKRIKRQQETEFCAFLLLEVDR